MDAVDEIKSRISIEDVVSQYVSLKRAGRHFKGLCPFHQEKTPSFIVSPERQLAYCFGCRRGGDVFKFIEEVEGVDFRGALELLAERTGVSLPRRGRRPAELKSERSEKDRLYALLARASAFFQERLWKSKEGKQALQYLEKRGFDEKLIKDFNIGYAPDAYDALYPQLLREGCTSRELLQAGLVFSRETSGERLGDFFRHRLMFPIENLQGAVCAFGGRVLRDADEPKYLNSPESPVFSKRTALYALSKGKIAMRKEGRAVLVEGYTDVMASYQAGVPFAVATCGTGLTEEQIKLVKRFAPAILLAFDSDEAGRQAQTRAVRFCQKAEIAAHLVLLHGKDPADMVKEDQKSWQAAVANAPYYLDAFYKKAEKELRGASLRKREQALHEYVPYLAGIVDPSERDGAVRSFSYLFQMNPARLYESVQAYGTKEKSLEERALRGVSEESIVSVKISVTQYLLGLLVLHPDCFSYAVDKLAIDDFPTDQEKRLYNFLQQYYSTATSEESDPFLVMPEDDRENAQIFTLYAETRNSTLTPGAVESEMRATVDAVVKRKQEARLQNLISQMRAAEHDQKKEQFQQYLEEYQALLSLWQKR